jgi:hypothetical protein
VRRRFERKPTLEMPTDFPDWDLIGRIEQLLRPHEDRDYFLGPLTISVEDDRGRYEAGELDALKKEFQERRSRAVESIDISVKASTHDYHISMSSKRRPYARLAGDDEIAVNGIASRLSEMFRDAAPSQSSVVERPRIHTEGRAGPHEHRESLRERLLPPHDWTTWLGLALGAGGLIAAIVVPIVLR